MNNFVLIKLVICTVCSAAGGIYLKHYADTSLWQYFAVSMIAYTTSNLLFISILKAGGFAFYMTLAAMLNLCCVALAGYLLFGERFSSGQWVGLGFAVLSIAFMALKSA